MNTGSLLDSHIFPTIAPFLGSSVLFLSFSLKSTGILPTAPYKNTSKVSNDHVTAESSDQFPALDGLDLSAVFGTDDHLLYLNIFFILFPGHPAHLVFLLIFWLLLSLFLLFLIIFTTSKYQNTPVSIP